MKRSSQRGPTGIISYDVPDILAPVRHCVQGLQDQIDAGKLPLLREMNRDPVPQISNDVITSATNFLEEAKAAMQGELDAYRPECLPRVAEERMKGMQVKARESARRLALMLADSSSKFDGNEMHGQLVHIKEGSQDAHVKQRLFTLKTFFDTFGKSEWLGELCNTRSFAKQIQAVLDLLQGLLEPQKTGLTPEQQVAEQKKRVERARRFGFGRAHVEQPLTTSLRAGKHTELFWRADRHDSSYDATRTAAVAESEAIGVENPLVDVQADRGNDVPAVEDCLNHLMTMCNALKAILEGDGRKKAQMQADLKVKMESLVDFALVLNDISRVLKQYVLLRLGDIDQQHLNILKMWVTHAEATEMHQMLEAFRDEANVAQAFHRLRNEAAGSSRKRRRSPRSPKTCASSAEDPGLYQAHAAEETSSEGSADNSAKRRRTREL
eukprot:TRINITY_DN32454_c0_g1_i1.p1 TRINITY_DN32454_c0_g1~~TRINITY_DN32454_c0_g1_i1.p1  ORF type:complete len:487 (+),score=95.85 TRINITY_DN32454_c0_g1_i1:147-1463(+)